MSSEDKASFEAINERLDELAEVFDEVIESVDVDMASLVDQIKELQNNMSSVISMFTQMNISLLQIQNNILNKEEK